MTNSTNDLRIAVTGAGGFLGRNLCHYLRDRGAEIFQLTSRPIANASAMPAARFTLSDGVAKGFFAENKINALVHTAYDFTPRTRAAIWDCNVRGSINLFAQARAEGVERIVFVSSMSAYDGCRSLFGQAKLEIENALTSLTDRGRAIRPGLIYSTPPEESDGIVGSIIQSLQRGVIPLIGKGQQELYLSHQNDLAQLIDWLLNSPAMGGAPIIAANPRAYTFREIIQLLAQTNRTRAPRLVPVPWRLAWAGVRSLEAAGVNTKFRSDSILSLVHQNPHPDFSTTPGEVVFRDFGEAIAANSS